MPAYTIPAGSNYTITQFVRSRAIKSLTFMVGNGKIKRLTLSPEVLIFNRPIFFILSSYFTQPNDRIHNVTTITTLFIISKISHVIDIDY